MNQDEWIVNATKKLQANNSSSARLDALVLLSYVTKQDKATILAYPETTLATDDVVTLTMLLNRRCNGEPIAYITGVKEFYGREFVVTPDVLVPRPETEDFIDLLKNHAPTTSQKLIDIGTGSGILAVSAKIEFPTLSVYATDVSKNALRVAASNANNHKATIKFMQSNLFTNVPGSFDYIFANLPYVPRDYPVSAEVHSEPRQAVFADNHGLELIFRLADQSKNNMTQDSLIFIESLIEQQQPIHEYYIKIGYTAVDKAGLVQVFKR